MQAEGELGDHPEVPAAAADRPEQVRVGFPARRPNLAIGGDDLHFDQLVDGEPETARQVSESTTEGQAGHPGLRHEAEGGGQPMLLGGPVHIAEKTAGANVNQSLLGIDTDLSHQ